MLQTSSWVGSLPQISGLVEGDEYGQLYGNAYLRDSKTGKIIVDANGLPLITSGVQKIGNPNPKYQIGITNTFNFKTFAFSIPDGL